jgi:hypothetical protein
MTCMYFRVIDHEKEDCITLLVKIYDKRNQDNHNFQCIVLENKEEYGKNINIVTRGGAKTIANATKKDQVQYHWLGKNIIPQQNFDAHN